MKPAKEGLKIAVGIEHVELPHAVIGGHNSSRLTGAGRPFGILGKQLVQLIAADFDPTTRGADEEGLGT